MKLRPVGAWVVVLSAVLEPSPARGSTILPHLRKEDHIFERLKGFFLNFFLNPQTTSKLELKLLAWMTCGIMTALIQNSHGAGEKAVLIPKIWGHRFHLDPNCSGSQVI